MSSSSGAAPSAAETDTQAAAVANTSGVTPASLQKTLTEKLEAQHVDIEDMSGERERITLVPPKKKENAKKAALSDVD